MDLCSGFNGNLICGICYNILDDPQILPCDHSFCKTPCLIPFQGLTTNVLCPYCYTECSVSDLGPNVMLRAKLRAYHNVSRGIIAKSVVCQTCLNSPTKLTGCHHCNGQSNFKNVVDQSESLHLIPLIGSDDTRSDSDTDVNTKSPMKKSIAPKMTEIKNSNGLLKIDREDVSTIGFPNSCPAPEFTADVVSRSVSLTGIKINTSQDILKSFFESYGAVSYIHLRLIPRQQFYCGFATFEQKSVAKTVLSIGTFGIADSNVVARPFRPKSWSYLSLDITSTTTQQPPTASIQSNLNGNKSIMFLSKEHATTVQSRIILRSKRKSKLTNDSPSTTTQQPPTASIQSNLNENQSIIIDRDDVSTIGSTNSCSSPPFTADFVSRSVSMTGIKTNTSQEMLKSYFEGYGAVSYIHFRCIPGQQLHCGFATFEQNSVAKTVLSLGTFRIADSNVVARPFQPRSWSYLSLDIPTTANQQPSTASSQSNFNGNQSVTCLEKTK